MPSDYGTLRAEKEPWRRPAKRRPSQNGRGPRRRKTRGKPRRRSFLGGLIKFTLVGAAIGAFALAVLIAYYAQGLPPTDQLFGVKGTPSVTVLDVNGKVVAKRGAGVGEIIPVSQMSPYLPQAVLAIEDRRFYDHFGIDPMALVRALLANAEAGHVVQGGSTITQQLAKNLFLTPEQTIERKVEEAILAFWLEMKFTKDEILTLYLNRAYFGAGTYGVEAAARRYFNKSARDVTLKEAATLAGLLKAPSRLSPINDAQAAEDRAQIVLAAMVEAGFISSEQRADAGDAVPRLAVTRSSPGADYFVDWVLEQVPAFIGGQPEGDIVIETTLDLAMQQQAEAAVAKVLDEKGEKLKIGQGAFVAMTPEGEIRAMVGGRSYADSQFNRAAQAQRPPGSSFKPFVFLAALEAGYTPQSIVLDAPIKLKNWSPGNYTRKYEGEVTLVQALAHSLNTVAVRLIVDVTPDSVVSVAKRLGILSPLNAQPALALGTSEVNLLELVSAYAPFANGGHSAMGHGIIKIRTRGGKALYERQGSGPMEVVPAVFAAEMTYMMREVVLAGTGKRARLADRDAAGKTGTGQDYRDAWFVGFTRDLVAGVWVGNDDNASMTKVTGGSVPAEIWNAFMTEVEKDMPPGPLVAIENSPETDIAAGTGWHEDGGGPTNGAAMEEPVAGGYTVLESDIPVDAEPMDVNDSAELDRMLEDMFGKEGSLKVQSGEARRPGT